MNNIHTCSYICYRPECIKAQRDELVAATAQEAVATVESFTNGSYHRNYKLRWHKNVDAGTQLFAAPVTAAPAEPDLDANDPASGELAAQWLYGNGFKELAFVVRTQLDMRGARIRELSASTTAAPADSLSPLARIADAFGVKGTWDQIADAVIARGTPAAPGIDLTSLVPAEREKPELMMATWHEVAGWNACVAEIRRRIDSSPKGALNEQFGSAE